MNIFHYKKSSREYKALDISPVDTNDAVFVSISNGVKNGKRDRISMKANKQELAYLIMECTKIYNALEDEKDDYHREN